MFYHAVHDSFFLSLVQCFSDHSVIGSHTISYCPTRLAYSLCMIELKEAGLGPWGTSHGRTSIQASYLGDWPQRDIVMIVLS